MATSMVVSSRQRSSRELNLCSLRRESFAGGRVGEAGGSRCGNEGHDLTSKRPAHTAMLRNLLPCTVLRISKTRKRMRSQVLVR